NARGREGAIYEEDYAAIEALQQLAITKKVAILIVTHTRKPKAQGGGDDPLDEGMATTGRTGAADGILVLKRPRYSPTGKLFVTGRDITEEREVVMTFDPSCCLWTLQGDVDQENIEAHLGKEKSEVRRVLREASGPLSIIEISARMGRSPDD